jgi:hypothetical protein
VGNNGVPGNDVTNDPTTGALGYPSGAGYDLASGLGSVDANNLINAWNTAAAAFQGSKTTLSPTTAVNITHGQSVTLTVNVTKNPTGAGPTGNVSLIASGGNLANSFGVAAGALTSGSSSITLNDLPGGTSYSLTANYPGDGTFAGSTSSAISVTVAKEPPAVGLLDLPAGSTHFTSGPLSASYGTPIAIEALVSGSSSSLGTNLTGNGDATGTITFTDTLGSTTTNLSPAVPLVFDGHYNAGTAEFFDCSGTQNCLAPGTHTVNGSYPGDNSFTSGNSSTLGFTLTITVASATTTTTVSSTATGTTVTSTTPVTLNATVATTSSGAAPNGKVTFFSNGAQLGSPVAVTGTAGNQTFFGVGTFASATAALTIALPAGTDNITAQYDGDTGGTNYAASPVSSAIIIISNSIIDFDGNGKADIGVFRPSSGTWFIIPSSNPTSFILQQWGASGDVVVPGDYDGDGKTDFAVFRPSTGTWYIIPSSNPNAPIVQQWGTQGDIPVPGNYDGDGKTDIAVFRPSTGTWYIIPSSNPSAPITKQWGTSGDIPVPGDYDGDRKTDIAVWRASNGVWYIIPSSTPTNFTVTQWGTNGDVPVQKPIGQ